MWPVFARRRAWLGELCRIAARLLADAYAVTLPGGKPGLILFVQTFGDLVNFNPHVHVLAADGPFLLDGRFVTLPAVLGSLFAELMPELRSEVVSLTAKLEKMVHTLEWVRIEEFIGSTWRRYRCP